MRKGLIVLLEGPRVDDVAAILIGRLLELGRNAEWMDAPASSCKSLVRSGVIVITADAGLEPEGVPRLSCPLSAHDTPDFAAEKILDKLAEAGVVVLDNTGYSPEDEERIRERLADLGYIE